MKAGGAEAAKEQAGESAAAAVTDGQVVGLGTGSTAAYAIRALGRRVADGLDIKAVPTSYQARELAREEGIPLVTLAEASVDLAIDGADQEADGQLVKGGGAAHVREKLVDTDATTFHVVLDASKRAETLTHPVPLAVLPAARRPVTDAVAELGGEPTLRMAERKDGPVVTDDGNLVIDCVFDAIEAPAKRAASLGTIPGVVGHGLFVDCADVLHIGHEDDVTVEDL
jgi:ribose 5-phosphate isomerase A